VWAQPAGNCAGELRDASNSSKTTGTTFRVCIYSLERFSRIASETNLEVKGESTWGWIKSCTSLITSNHLKKLWHWSWHVPQSIWKSLGRNAESEKVGKARSWNWPGASSSARKLSESLSKTAELQVELSATMCENFSVNEDFLVCLRSPGWAQALGETREVELKTLNKADWLANPKRISKGLNWKLKQIKGWWLIDFQGLTWRFLMGNLTDGLRART